MSFLTETSTCNALATLRAFQLQAVEQVLGLFTDLSLPFRSADTVVPSYIGQSGASDTEAPAAQLNQQLAVSRNDAWPVILHGSTLSGMNARGVTRSLGGRWLGWYGRSPCPHCGGGTSGNFPLSIKPHPRLGVIVHCFKGCDWRDVHHAMRREGIGFDHTLASPPAPTNQNSDKAARIWQEAKPLPGTKGEAYLRGRHLSCPLPANLRYHPALWHGPSQQTHPALVARVSDVAIHRTFIGAVSEPRKMMLGVCKGGAVRLTEGQGPLVVAEGVETALSLSCGLLSGIGSLWAALSTSGMQCLSLPPTAGHLIIATDGDAAGNRAGNALAERATHSGWKVGVLRAPSGKDWNDVLREMCQ